MIFAFKIKYLFPILIAVKMTAIVVQNIGRPSVKTDFRNIRLLYFVSLWYQKVIFRAGQTATFHI